MNVQGYDLYQKENRAGPFTCQIEGCNFFVHLKLVLISRVHNTKMLSVIALSFQLVKVLHLIHSLR